MKLDDFQESLQALSPLEFERFVVNLLAKTGDFKNIRAQSRIERRQVDVLAELASPLLGQPQKWVFEIRRTRIVGRDVADRLLGLMADIQERPMQFVLVTAGIVNAEAQQALLRHGVLIWDLAKLAELVPPELLQEYFGPHTPAIRSDTPSDKKVDALITALTDTESGKPNWPAYQRLVSDILEFLFCPPLEPPRYELADAEARNRRDILFENLGRSDFWSQVRADYSAHYIVVDPKNYKKPVPKRTVLDVAHYLKPYGCGMFALLVSRRGPASDALHATREQWIGGRKMIVHLSDATLKEMLELRKKGGQPQEVIRRLIADFRMSL